MSSAPKRFLLTTFGSFGDLHPYIAVALELKSRGHHPVIATSNNYRKKVTAIGLDFVAVRPDLPDDPEGMRELGRKVMDATRGPEFVFREVVMPHLRATYDDLMPAAREADVIVGHPLMLTVPLVAEKRNKPWASVALAPLSYFSASDPPVLPGMAWLNAVHRRFPWTFRAMLRLSRGMLRRWCKPWYALRAELGLPADDRIPMLDGQHSPHLSLGMFSSRLGSPQADWPANSRVTGFAFYDRDGEDTLAPALEQFLADGEPPVVFTLGTSGVLTPGAFYDVSREVAERLGIRAVLLVGKEPAGVWSSTDRILVCDYAPYSALFPRSAAVVHQGGAGTTGQAMRAGTPMLVVPYAHDQPDNAARVVRIGVARTVGRNRYRIATGVRELGELLGNRRYAERSAEVGAVVRAEGGARNAADALVELGGLG